MIFHTKGILPQKPILNHRALINMLFYTLLFCCLGTLLFLLLFGWTHGIELLFGLDSGKLGLSIYLGSIIGCMLGYRRRYQQLKAAYRHYFYLGLSTGLWSLYFCCLILLMRTNLSVLQWLQLPIFALFTFMASMLLVGIGFISPLTGILASTVYWLLRNKIKIFHYRK